MRKRVFGRKLGRNRNSRKALFRSLLRALVINGSITTTLPKAKAVRPEVDRVMGLVAKNNVSAKRRLMAKLGNDGETFEKLVGDYSHLCKGRKSGFTRIVALPKRVGDNAEMAKIEWVRDEAEVKEPKVIEKKVRKVKK
jgi:large subunit ribosomal protein L17